MRLACPLWHAKLFSWRSQLRIEEKLCEPRLFWLAVLGLLTAADSGLPSKSLGSRKQPKLACDSFSAAVALLRHTRSILSCSALLSPALQLAAACEGMAEQSVRRHSQDAMLTADKVGL